MFFLGLPVLGGGALYFNRKRVVSRYGRELQFLDQTFLTEVELLKLWNYLLVAWSFYENTLLRTTLLAQKKVLVGLRERTRTPSNSCVSGV